MKSMPSEREALILKEAEATATATARSFTILPLLFFSQSHINAGWRGGDGGRPDPLREHCLKERRIFSFFFLFFYIFSGTINQQGVKGRCVHGKLSAGKGREGEGEKKRGMSGRFGTAADAGVSE